MSFRPLARIWGVLTCLMFTMLSMPSSFRPLARIWGVLTNESWNSCASHPAFPSPLEDYGGSNDVGMRSILATVMKFPSPLEDYGGSNLICV